MHVRCPHCHNCIELVEDAPLADILCPSCGSSFNIVDRELSSTIDDVAGKRIAHFELIEQLGMGHFGSVWRARDTELDREVALKVPRKDQLDPAEMERFVREARAAAQLRHPHIVQVHEVGREGDQLYIVSDLIRGATLADWLTGQKLTPREAAELCITLAEALHHAHQCGVVHRDLKPGNIMLDLEGKPYVLDFGLAKRDAGEITMTVEGRVLGTPAYMSPEQARGEGHYADARSDIYSLGVTLFQLLTGELPFRGNQRMLLVQIQTEEAPSPRKLNSSIPRDLETITLKCIEKSADGRYQSAQALADELRRYVQGKPIHARPISRAQRLWRWSKRQPVVASLTVAFAATLISGAGISSYFGFQASVRAETARRFLYDAHMNLAQAAWKDGQVARVLELLEQHGPGTASDDLRGFEWHYWQRLCNSDLRTLKSSVIKGRVLSVAFSPDGALVAAGGDHGVEVWHAATGQPRMKLRHNMSVNSIAFSPDGHRIAWASKDLKIWDLTRNEEPLILKGHSTWIHSVAFSPDGGLLASASRDRTIKLWDAHTGKEIDTLKGHTDDVQSVAFSPDGSWIASGGSDATVKLWDTKSRKEIFTRRQTDSVSDVVFSPDGGRLASAIGDGTIKLWDVPTFMELRTLKGHNDYVSSVVFSPDGAWLASSSNDLTVKGWDATTGEEIRSLKGHTRWVHDVAFSPDGARIASGSMDHTVKLWDAGTRQESDIVPGLPSDSVVSPDFACVALSSSGGGLRLLDTITGQVIATLSPSAAENVTFSSDGKYVAFAITTNVEIWNTAACRKIATLKGHAENVTDLAFSPNGARIASASFDKTVMLRDVAGARTYILRGHTDIVLSVAFSPDGARLVSGSADGTVRVWHVDTAKEAVALDIHAEVDRVLFSPDGTRIAAIGQGWFKLLDASTYREISIAEGASSARSLAFSPNGARLAASGRNDHQITLLDTGSGRVIATMKGHTLGVQGVALGTDGTRLASSGWGMVKLWDVSTGQETATLAGASLAFSPDGTRLVSNYGTTWDARPATPAVKAEIEAVGALRFLFSVPVPKSEVVGAIKRDKIISEAARQKALELAGRFKEEEAPQKYCDAAWPVIRHPYSNVFVLQFALAQMKAACERAPENATYRIGLGIAQYRLGKFQTERFQEALATLLECDQTQPATLAFLAMAQYQLDLKDDAQATLARLRELMKESRWADDQQAQGFLREATELIEGTAAKPQP